MKGALGFVLSAYSEDGDELEENFQVTASGGGSWAAFFFHFVS